MKNRMRAREEYRKNKGYQWFIDNSHGYLHLFCTFGQTEWDYFCYVIKTLRRFNKNVKKGRGIVL